MTQAASPPTPAPTTLSITSLDQEGRGLARLDGKAVFVEGALPGEEVTYTTLKRKPTYEIARAESILVASPARVDPRCPHFGVCGGCSLQHFDAAAQVAAKQRTLEDTLWHLGRVRPAQLLPAIHGPAWGYRHRARLSVRYVAKKGGVLVGFHEKKSSYVADMTSCAILPPRISALLPRLRELVGSLTIRDRLPQIELAVGDGTDPAHVLVLRILAPLAETDEASVRAFADRHDVCILSAARRTRNGGTLPPACAVARLRAARVRPRVSLLTDRVHAGQRHDQPRARAPRHGAARSGTRRARCGLLLRPRQFHAADRAPRGKRRRRRGQCRARPPRRGERRAERARRARDVPGRQPVRSHAGNGRGAGSARQGAHRSARARARSRWSRRCRATVRPQRIVYVSCNPATLARDAAVLVHDHGYALAAAGVVNMFPHTAHVESIALFHR